jgi:hypothetical protein
MRAAELAAAEASLKQRRAQVARLGDTIEASSSSWLASGG